MTLAQCRWMNRVSDRYAALLARIWKSLPLLALMASGLPSVPMPQPDNCPHAFVCTDSASDAGDGPDIGADETPN
jgi:hypothetical protein